MLGWPTVGVLSAASDHRQFHRGVRDDYDGGMDAVPVLRRHREGDVVIASRRLRLGMQSRRLQAVPMQVDHRPSREEQRAISRQARRLGLRVVLVASAGEKP